MKKRVASYVPHERQANPYRRLVVHQAQAYFQLICKTFAYNKTAHVKLKLDMKKVTLYADNMSYNIAPVDSYYEFNLLFGKDVFSTIE